jgi:predicted N-acetyltransferase YhbS
VSIWVRLAAPDDAPALSALALQAKRHWGYPPEWIDLWKEELMITPEYLARHTAFVAAEDGAPIGMCALEQRAAGGAIEHVWIAPNRHSLGVGRALVMRALREAAVAGMTSVRVVSDPCAEGFYSRLGAERRGEIPSPMPGAPDRMLPVLVFGV